MAARAGRTDDRNAAARRADARPRRHPLYFDGGAATDPARAGTLATWQTELPQVVPFIAVAQMTAGVRAGVTTRFSPYWEARGRGFRQMVLDAIAGDLQAGRSAI